MSIRSTLLACITALACIAVLIAYVHKNTRYEMVSGQDGVYLLDRQTTLIHHCNKEKCTLLSPEGSSVEAMRALAGIPSVDLVRKDPPQTCMVPEKKPEPNYANINISSLQSLTQPMPSMNEIKNNSGDALGMGKVNQQVQKPQNPFPNENSGAPEPQASSQQPAPEAAAIQSTEGNGSNYGETQSTENQPAPEALNNPYGEAASNVASPETKAENNPYGAAASNGAASEAEAINNPYGAAASNGASSGAAPYPAG
ncbi:MAG TPA: hypothetical protein DIC42_02775 [Holosporales bacterium]|nr:hypothetical protein [Holosporales bacterium]